MRAMHLCCIISAIILTLLYAVFPLLHHHESLHEIEQCPVCAALSVIGACMPCAAISVDILILIAWRIILSCFIRMQAGGYALAPTRSPPAL